MSVSLQKVKTNLGLTAGESGNIAWQIAGTALGASMIYHGYKRHCGSIGWGLVWGIFAPFNWPFAIAQGFGKPDETKPGCRLKRL